MTDVEKAAREVILAGDTLRKLTQVGKETTADRERVKEANEKLDKVRGKRR